MTRVSVVDRSGHGARGRKLSSASAGNADHQGGGTWDEPLYPHTGVRGCSPKLSGLREPRALGRCPCARLRQDFGVTGRVQALTASGGRRPRTAVAHTEMDPSKRTSVSCTLRLSYEPLPFFADILDSNRRSRPSPSCSATTPPKSKSAQTCIESQ